MGNKNKTILITILLIISQNYIFCFKDLGNMYSNSYLKAMFKYNVGRSLGDFQIYEDLSKKNITFNIGNNAGFDLGIKYDFLTMDNILFGMEVGYQQINTDFVVKESTIINFYGTLQNCDFSYIFKNNLNLVYFMPALSFLLSDRLIINSGYMLSIKTGNNSNLVKRIDNPDWVTFVNENGENTYKREIFSEIKEKTNSINHHLSLGICYLLNLNKSNTLFLVPELGANFKFNSPYNDYKWITVSVQFGIGIVWRFESKQSEIYKLHYNEPNLDSINALNTNKFNNSLILISDSNQTISQRTYNSDVLITDFSKNDSVNKNNDSNNTNNSNNSNNTNNSLQFKNNQKIRKTHNIPIINKIFFNKDDSKIKDKYLINKDLQFNINDEFINILLYTHYSYLDTLANRLNENKSARIILNASILRNSNFNYVLAKNRMENLKLHFINHFKINPERIGINSNIQIFNPKVKLPTQEFDYIEITSDDNNINKPIELIIEENSNLVSEDIKNDENYYYLFFGYNEINHKKDLSFDIVHKINLKNEIIINIDGFTDSQGELNYNKSLSLKRANKIKSIFQSNAIVNGFGVIKNNFTEDIPEINIISRVVRIKVK